VRVDDRAAGHERERRLRVALDLREAALEDDVVRVDPAEDPAGEPADLEAQLLRSALPRLQTRDRELRRVRPGEAGVRVPVRVVARSYVDLVGRDAEDVAR